MIQLRTKVNVIDNSGGSIARCLKILDPHGRNYAKIGDIILVSIKETVKLPYSNLSTLNKKGGTKKGGLGKGDSGRLTRGSMYKALVVRTKSNSLNLPNSEFNNANFEDNAVILLKSNLASKKNLGLVPLGTRIKGPISNVLNLRNEGNKFNKVLSLSKLHY